ncbi:uncharacterized protein ACRADG_005411 [Cochliomyia hominivorax]
MFTLKSLYVSLIFWGSIAEIFSSEYLHLGNTEKELKQAEYYLSADGGSNTIPTNELKRTQRSFWKKLFKNGLFGESDNCCNNCDYNVGNGDNYSPITSPLLPFQPWSPLPLWRPLQPLFGPVTYDGYGRNTCNGINLNSYDSTPSYDVNTYSDNSPTSYDNSLLPTPETAYEIPPELPSPEGEYKIENNPVVDDIYQPSPDPRPIENSYKVPETLSYASEEIPKTVQRYTNEKVPQILYQPIIYVSPLYQGKENLKQYKNEEMGCSEGFKNETNVQKEEQNSDTESNQSLKKSELDYTNSVISNSKEEASETQNSNDGLLHKNKYITSNSQQPTQCLSYTPTNPSISTVSTVYNVISPSLFHSLTTSQNPYIASTGVCANVDTPKNTLYPSNIVPIESSIPAQAKKISLTPLPNSASGVLASTPLTNAYTQPIHLTPDDQPYRVCPELFQEYQRKLNTILPYGSNIGNTFINAQLISY